MAFAALAVTGASEGRTLTGIAAEVMPSGSVIRINTSNRIEKADAEVATTDNCDGVLITEANAVGQQVLYAPPGETISGLSGLTAGQTYYLGGAANEGQVGLFADATTGTHFATIVGIALSASRLFLVCKNTDVQL